MSIVISILSSLFGTLGNLLKNPMVLKCLGVFILCFAVWWQYDTLQDANAELSDNLNLTKNKVSQLETDLVIVETINEQNVRELAKYKKDQLEKERLLKELRNKINKSKKTIDELRHEITNSSSDMDGPISPVLLSTLRSLQNINLGESNEP